MNKIQKLLLAAAAVSTLAACDSTPRWQVKGTVEGGEGKFLALEASNGGIWYPLDTITLKSNGKFDFKHEAAGFPDVYRLTVDGQSVYFPIDSIETVNVSANAGNFSSASISGTPLAQAFTTVDSLVSAAVGRTGSVQAMVKDEELKNRLANMVLADPSGIVAYYVINKRVADTPLYNPAERSDLRIIGAVANSYITLRPNDPRTAYLKKLYLSNRPVAPGAGISDAAASILEANKLSLIDIELLDPAGKKVKLSDVADENSVVLLNFTALTAAESPEFNIALAKVYDQYKNRGLKIYQVSIDADEFAWRQSAKNLPWISVYNGANDLTPLLRYNVGAIPVSFIIDRGTIVERVADHSTLASSLGKYL